MSLKQLEIVINGVTYENNFEQAITADRSDMNTEFYEYSKNLHYFAALWAEAKHWLRKEEHKLEIIEASIDANVRRQSDELNKKVTEPLIKKEIILHPDYRTQRDKVSDVELLVDRLSAMKNSIQAQKDMIEQMAFDARHGSNEPRFIEQKAHHVRASMNNK
jgi:hypothetical protein